MKKIFLIISIFITVIALVFFLIKFFGQSILNDLAGGGYTQVEKPSPVINGKLLGKPVPFFDLLNIDHKRIKLADYVKKPLVIVFWATWNVEGANQLKIFDEYLSSSEKDDSLVSIISINSQEEESVVKSFMRRGGYEVITALDTSGASSQDFNIKSLPTTFFIDRDGVVREIYSGVLSKSVFVDKVEQLLQ